MPAVLSAREQSDGKRCPNCAVEGKGAGGEHDIITLLKGMGMYVFRKCGWRCWNCGYEWGFEE